MEESLGSTMPKEEPCLSECSPCATSSKNAKDKSNTSIPVATGDTKDTDDGRGSRCSSEKDSGYSDGSEWQQTDVEDQQRNRSQSREGAETSQGGQNQDQGQGNLRNPSLAPAGHEPQPIYIIKNMALKQPNMIQKRGQLLWRNRGRETSSSGRTHMLLFQQPTLMPATLQLQKPLRSKANVTGKKSGTYLPILNSYPRIAPHPSKKPLDKSPLNDDSQNLSKRVCTEHKSEHAPVAAILPVPHPRQEPKLAVQTATQPCTSSTKDSLPFSSHPATSSSQVSTSASGRCATSSFLAARGLHRNVTGARHCRFLNTIEVLKRSGLLDITLRTKELLRQSNATERDIAQLRQHTELLYQAACNPSCNPNGVTAWENLCRAMAESGSYRLLAAEDSGTPQPPLLSTTPGSSQNCPGLQQSSLEQRRELEASKDSSEQVTFMSPDSSTG